MTKNNYLCTSTNNVQETTIDKKLPEHKSTSSVQNKTSKIL